MPAVARYQQLINGANPPRWLLCQASTVQQPATGSELIMLLQLDITESQKVGAARTVAAWCIPPEVHRAVMCNLQLVHCSTGSSVSAAAVQAFLSILTA